jgi:hypothetical protein
MPQRASARIVEVHDLFESLEVAIEILRHARSGKDEVMRTRLHHCIARDGRIAHK